jgi:hypothetical protein
MKYVKSFESHKNSKKQEPVNEELLGGVINFFKNLWNKAVAELEKLGDKPKQEDITNWISKNTLNPADDSYMFKQQMDDFKKKPEANDQDCLTLVDGILNPETGALGKQGLQPMMDTLNKKYPPKQGETMHWIPADTQYVFQVVRNKAIVQYKFAGGPADGKVDPKKINVDLKDVIHLPEFKKLLTAAVDGKKKKEVTITWVEKNLIPQLVKFEQAITGDELDKNLADKKITFTGTGEGEVAVDYKVGDTVVYKREKFDQVKWDALTDDDKKKPEEGKMKELQAEQIGIKKISKIEGDKISFEGADFTKTMADLIMKSEVEAEGQEDLVKKLGELKTKSPENIKKVGSYVDFISDEANKDKVAEIDKIIGGGEATA